MQRLWCASMIWKLFFFKTETDYIYIYIHVHSFSHFKVISSQPSFLNTVTHCGPNHCGRCSRRFQSHGKLWLDWLKVLRGSGIVRSHSTPLKLQTQTVISRKSLSFIKQNTGKFAFQNVLNRSPRHQRCCLILKMDVDTILFVRTEAHSQSLWIKVSEPFFFILC